MIRLMFLMQTGSEFKEQEAVMRLGPPAYNRSSFSPYCYDAIYTLAYALNETFQSKFTPDALALASSHLALAPT